MKTSLYVPPVRRVEVTLTFTVGGLHHEPTEGELYNILEDIAKGHEGERTYDGRTYNLVLENAAAATKRRQS